MKFRWQKSGQLNGALEDLHFVILAIVEFPWVTFPCILFITNVTLSQTVPIVYLRCYIFFKHQQFCLRFRYSPAAISSQISLFTSNFISDFSKIKSLFTSNFVSDFVIHQQFDLRFRYLPAILSQISLFTSNFVSDFVIHLQQFYLRFRYSPAAILSQISLFYHFQTSIFLCVFVSFKENILLLSVDCWEDKFWCSIKL